MSLQHAAFFSHPQSSPEAEWIKKPRGVVRRYEQVWCEIVKPMNRPSLLPLYLTFAACRIIRSRYILLVEFSFQEERYKQKKVLLIMHGATLLSSTSITMYHILCGVIYYTYILSSGKLCWPELVQSVSQFQSTPSFQL